MRQRRKNKMIIMSLLGFLFLMTVGYAAFQTNLKIKGTSSISSNWDIRITDVTEGNKTGDAESAKAPTWDKLTANVEANLYQKGDSIEYIITVENKGTIDAFLSNITTNETKHEAIKFTVEGPNSNDKLFKGESTRIKVKIEYNLEFNGVPEVGSSELNITLDYVQAVVAGNEILNPNLYVSSTGNDKTGVGSTTNPYKTLQKAYEEAGSEATIYIMDDITQTETFNLNENKNITLTSYGVNHSIIRADNLKQTIISQNEGILTLENITIDGNNVEAQDAMINVASQTNIENNTLITKANNINDFGAALCVNGGTLTMNGGEISNNRTKKGGGAIYSFSDGCANSEWNFVCKRGIVKINGGKISNNNADLEGGAIANYGDLFMNGGIITLNNAKTSGGGVYSSGIMEMNGGEISNNKTLNTDGSGDGGGIYIESDSKLTINSGDILNNFAGFFGGGIYTGARSNFILKNGKILNNSVTQNSTLDSQGGGLYLIGTIILYNGEIANNTSHQGGGIMNYGTLTIENVKIHHNITETNAGGIRGGSGSKTIINGGEIYDNEASFAGGGVEVYANTGTKSTLDINGGVIRNNKAYNGGGIYISINTGGTLVFTFNGGTVRNNIGTSTNGGIRSMSGITYTYKKGVICGNKPTNSLETSATCPS